MKHKNLALINYCQLTWVMTQVEIKARYKRAVFGFLWILLNPLLQMIIIGFVLGVLTRVSTQNYFWFLLTGLVPWNFISQSWLAATTSVVTKRALIKKAKFPHEVIPLSVVMANAIQLIFVLFCLLIVAIIFFHLGGFDLSRALYIIGAAAWFLFITIGLSLITSALHVRFRDIHYLVQTLIVLWFYASPIVYSPQDLPSNYIGLLYINPLVYPLQMIRRGVLLIQFSELQFLWPNLVLTVLIFTMGAVIFRREHAAFSDWL